MRVAVVFDTPYQDNSPAAHMERMQQEIGARKEVEPEQEYQIGHCLLENKHDVVFIGARGDPDEFLAALDANPVDLAFNCTEGFGGIDSLDYLLPSLLEFKKVRYTGASPLALMLTRNKALSKELLAHHGVRTPHFATFVPGEPISSEVSIRFPAIVKPMQLDASAGVSQASVVRDAEALVERVKFIHERFSSPAIAEEFIEGRELYVSVLGNGSELELLPPCELIFDKEKTEPEQRIATQRAKWDEEYREKRGIKHVIARPISQRARQEIAEMVTAAHRALRVRDYARFDIRLSTEDEVWIIEANANPYLSHDHEIQKSAENAGISHEELIERIVREALARKAI